MKKSLKVLKITSYVIAIIIFVLVVSIFSLKMARPLIFKDFENKSEKSFSIPGLNKDYVPQGLCYNKNKKLYLFCGYMTDKSNSKIFILDENGSLVKEINLLKKDGNKYSGHAGGISSVGEHVYISNASKIFHVSLSSLLNCENEGYVQFDGEFKVPTRSSFCFANDNYLLVGEYTEPKGKSYSTDESHHFTKNDVTNKALCVAYKIDENQEFGVDVSKVEYSLSLPSYVQGIALDEQNNIYLSESHGISFSYLESYKVDFSKEDGTFDDSKLYFLGKDNLVSKIKMPPMSEEIDYVDGTIIVNYESASKKYGIFNIWKNYNIIKYTIN